MKFNFWFVIFLALTPVFILFTGLSVAGGLQSSAAWPVTGMAIAAAIAAGYHATRGGDEVLEEAPTETIPRNDTSTPSAESPLGSEAGYSSPPCFLHELDPSYLGYSNREEIEFAAWRERSQLSPSELSPPAVPSRSRA